MAPPPPQLTDNIDLISLERFPAYRAVTLNKQLYNAASLAKSAAYAYKKSPGVPMTDAKVPHSRRAMSPQEMNRVMRLSGKRMSWPINAHMRIVQKAPAYGNYTSSRRLNAAARQEKFFEKTPQGIHKVQNRTVVGAEVRLVTAYARIVADTAATLAPDMAQYITAPEVDRVTRALQQVKGPDDVHRILVWPVHFYSSKRLRVVTIYNRTQPRVDAMQQALLRFSSAVTQHIRLLVGAGVLSKAELTGLNTLLVRLEHTMVPRQRGPRTGRRTRKATRRVRTPLDAMEVFTQLLGPVVSLGIPPSGAGDPPASMPRTPRGARTSTNRSTTPPSPFRNNVRRRRPTLPDSPARSSTAVRELTNAVNRLSVRGSHTQSPTRPAARPAR